MRMKFMLLPGSHCYITKCQHHWAPKLRDPHNKVSAHIVPANRMRLVR